MFVIGELWADWAIAYKCLGAIFGNSRDVKVVEADTNFVAKSVQNSSVELKEKKNHYFFFLFLFFLYLTITC